MVTKDNRTSKGSYDIKALSNWPYNDTLVEVRADSKDNEGKGVIDLLVGYRGKGYEVKFTPVNLSKAIFNVYTLDNYYNIKDIKVGYRSPMAEEDLNMMLRVARKYVPQSDKSTLNKIIPLISKAYEESPYTIGKKAKGYNVIDINSSREDDYQEFALYQVTSATLFPQENGGYSLAVNYKGKRYFAKIDKLESGELDMHFVVNIPEYLKDYSYDREKYNINKLYMKREDFNKMLEIADNYIPIDERALLRSKLPEIHKAYDIYEKSN